MASTAAESPHGHSRGPSPSHGHVDARPAHLTRRERASSSGSAGVVERLAVPAAPRQQQLAFEHTFRDRTRSKEVSPQEFGVHYEREKDRAFRNERLNQAAQLPREAWRSNQTAPHHVGYEMRHHGFGSAFRTTDYSQTSQNLTDTIGELLFSDLRLPYREPKPCEVIRPPQPKSVVGAPISKRRFNHALSATATWHHCPAPLAAVEPWQDNAKRIIWGKHRL